MPKVIHNLDLNGNEIQNVVLQPLFSAPSNPKIGQKYFNKNDNNEYRWNGTAWVTYQAPLSTTTASTISIPNGIVKGDGTTLTAATAGTDYQAPLPSQTGNSGKFLTTNGSALSWGSVDTEPEIFVATVEQYGQNNTTAAEIAAAKEAGKLLFLKFTGWNINCGLTPITKCDVINMDEEEVIYQILAYPISDVTYSYRRNVYELYWDNDYSDWIINNIGEAELPSQENNSGKFLTTNGSTASWGSITASGIGAQPSITANGILKGNGSGTITAAVAGTDYQAPLTAGTDYQTPITFDGTYNASTNKAATVSTVTNAINALDGGTIGTGSASKTITSLSQSNGNVSATFGDISITKSQVSDFPNIPSWALESSKPTYTASEVGAVATTAVGAASGVAPLNASRQIDPSYLPSYVDDVVEGYYNTTDGKFYEEGTYTTEITPEAGKIYIDLSTNKSYRWGGTTYVEMPTGSTVTVSQTLTSGEEVGTITIDGTTTTLYAPEDTDTKVTQTKVTPSSYTYWRTFPFGQLSASSATTAFATTATTGIEYSVDNIRFQPSEGILRIIKMASGETAATGKAGTVDTVRGTFKGNKYYISASGTNTTSYMSSDSANNIWFMVGPEGDTKDCVLCLYSNGTTKTVRSGGSAAGTVDLGTSTNNWKDLYLGGTIYNNPSSTTVASGDKILVNDTSAGTISSGITLGSSTTQYLANNGSWQNIPTGLPAVTSSDNGKILAVVDGAWSLVSVSDLLTIYNGATS